MNDKGRVTKQSMLIDDEFAELLIRLAAACTYVVIFGASNLLAGVGARTALSCEHTKDEARSS
eukprot:4707642-Amphidinium_carterae.1